jgi:hypothetical protein
MEERPRHTCTAIRGRRDMQRTGQVWNDFAWAITVKMLRREGGCSPVKACSLVQRLFSPVPSPVPSTTLVCSLSNCMYMHEGCTHRYVYHSSGVPSDINGASRPRTTYMCGNRRLPIPWKPYTKHLRTRLLRPQHAPADLVAI